MNKLDSINFYFQKMEVKNEVAKVNSNFGFGTVFFNRLRRMADNARHTVQFSGHRPYPGAR
jgi:hypothetical protein